MFSPRLTLSLGAASCFALLSFSSPAHAQLGFVEENGMWNGYFLDTTSRTWDDARYAAKSSSFGGVAGNLVAITSANESDRIREFIGRGRGNNPTVWIGFTDSDVTSTLADGFNGSSVGASEGEFRWVTGEAVTYTQWNNGEPNNYGSGEDATEWITAGGWNDEQSGSSLGQNDSRRFSLWEYRLTPQQIALSNTIRITNFVSNGTVTNLAAADDLRAGNNVNRSVVSYYTRTNMEDTGGPGDFASVEGVIGVAQADNFAIFGTGYLKIGAADAGNYVFRLNADDGQRLRIDLNGDGDFLDAGEQVVVDDVLSGPHNVDSASLALGPGSYAFEWTWFENGGGAEGELSASKNGGAFQLLGDTANGGLLVSQVVPEPGAASLLIGVGAFLAQRRRRA